jgi:hypothetical protein
VSRVGVGNPPAQDFIANLATLKAMFAEAEPNAHATEGSFESTCRRLFGITLPRGRHHQFDEDEDVEVDDDGAEQAIYREWESASVACANALPLEYSESIYNFAKIQEHTRRGRRGLPVPGMAKRRLYASECWAFLSYCSAELEDDWAFGGDYSEIWVNFLRTSTRKERDARNQAIGSYILQRNAGSFSFCA